MEQLKTYPQIGGKVAGQHWRPENVGDGLSFYMGQKDYVPYVSVLWEGRGTSPWSEELLSMIE